MLAITRNVPPGEVGHLLREAAESLGQLRRHDGSYDQTFVRLEILTRRPV
jgi:hypothetical protein